MSKSRDAFRTISEVSDMLDTPAHVLRFWESKFAQVKPVKRAGGRRYYRPTDVDLLAGIKQLLHEDGMTIKGAQKLLREQGVKHVAAMGDAILSAAADTPDNTVVDVTPDPVADTPAAETPSVETAPEPQPEPAPVAAEATEAAPDPAPEPEIGITNVVPLAPSAPANTGPALSLNLAPKADDTPAAAPDISGVPADPSDSDSKAPARIFHLIQNADAAKLNAQALAIAPLLDRMQVLRDRVAAR